MKQDQKLPLLIKKLIFPESRDEAMSEILDYGIEVFERLQEWISELKKDQPIPIDPKSMNDSNQPLVKHISTLHRAFSVFDLLHSCCFEAKCENLIGKVEEEGTLEELAILLSEWGTRISGDIVTQKLNEIASEFPFYVKTNSDGNSIEELLTDEQHFHLIKLLLKYICDCHGFKGSDYDYYNPKNR